MFVSSTPFNFTNHYRKQENNYGSYSSDVYKLECAWNVEFGVQRQFADETSEVES